MKQWLAAQEWQFDLTNDIPLDDIVGVRVRREGPAPGIEEMSGIFQGPLGKIYAVKKPCIRSDRKTEFRPIANAIIYSFDREHGQPGPRLESFPPTPARPSPAERKNCGSR